MPKKPKKARWKKPSNNPLNNLNLSDYTEPKKKIKKVKEDTYKNLEDEYKRILHKELQRGNRAYRVIYKDHPDLLYVAFKPNRASAKYESARYFRDTFNPFFTGEDYRQQMLNGRAYRVQELDKYASKGIPIPELLRVLDITMPCSVCGKDRFSYSDYREEECFIIEGEGNLNPFTRGYLLCHNCYKKYIGND
jgi:hypothetical protein